MRFQKRLTSIFLPVLCLCVVIPALTVSAKAIEQGVEIPDRTTFYCKKCEVKTEFYLYGLSVDPGYSICLLDSVLAGYRCSVCDTHKGVLYDHPGHYWEFSTGIPASCGAAGFLVYSCTRENCSERITETAPKKDHTWKEISRTDPTETSPGLVEFICTVCDKTKSETISVPSPSGSMGEVLSTISAVMTAALSWVAIVADRVAHNPILLIVVIISFLGTGAVLFKRLLRL